MAWNGGAVQAPVARNPFAPAPPAGLVGVLGGPGQAGAVPNEAFTGPTLGRGSELQMTYAVPRQTGHTDGVNCLLMVDDRVCSGGRDEMLCTWRGTSGPNGFELVPEGQPIHLGSAVTSLCYDPTTKWLFCGLWNGDIRAFCKDPFIDDRLVGHRRSVASLAVHAGVVISGSNEGMVRLWTRSPQTGRFQCHGQPLNNPSGAITSVRVLGDGLWVGAQNGITCFDLTTLQPRGTLASNHQVTGLVECQGFMLATYRNGDLKIFDAAGNETFHLPSRGEHTSNTAVEMMVHPIANKPMVLCGQQYGYVTAYDLPDFHPRGSFVCKQGSDVKAILDVKAGGMFLTGGVHGDIHVWQWGAPGAGSPTATPTATSPFAPAPVAGMVPNPFAAAPAAAPFGGCGGAALGGGGIGMGGPGDLMMG